MTLYNCGELVSQHTYKSKVFAYQIFKTGAPVIEKLPVVMKYLLQKRVLINNCKSEFIR